MQREGKAGGRTETKKTDRGKQAGVIEWWRDGEDAVLKQGGWGWEGRVTVGKPVGRGW